MNGEKVELVERFTYLGSDIHANIGCDSEVTRRLGRACGVMDSLDKGVWRCRYLTKRSKVRAFRSLVLPVLLYGCETWTLTKGLRNRLNAFGTRALRRISGYRWSDFVSNQRLLAETTMSPVTYLIRERQLRLFGHVARYHESDPAYQALFAEDPDGWKRPVGRPHASWSQQVGRYLSEMDLDWESARGMAKEDPRRYRLLVDAATRCSGVCPHI